MDKFTGYGYFTGVIKYDAKHDRYFIDSKGKVFTIPLLANSSIGELEGETVEFIHNSANEVFSVFPLDDEGV